MLMHSATFQSQRWAFCISCYWVYPACCILNQGRGLLQVFARKVGFQRKHSGAWLVQIISLRH